MQLNNKLKWVVKMPDFDPLQVSWYIVEGGRKKKVNIFQIINEVMGGTTQQWNRVGPGSILFGKGTLHFQSWDETPQNVYKARLFYLNAKIVRERTESEDTFKRGLEVFFSIIGNPAEVVKLEKEAYPKMLKYLDDYLSGKDFKVIHSTAKHSGKKLEIIEKRGKLRKEYRGMTLRFEDRHYSETWQNLIYNVILKNTPKVEGTAVGSFSLRDLMSVEIGGTRSPFRSIYMMEEFGTGLFVDPGYRRRFESIGTTPYKVQDRIANQWKNPEAVYTWFTFFNFLQKARTMTLSHMNRKSGTTTNWIKEMLSSHTTKRSLKEYRKDLYNTIKKYNQEKTGSMDPLQWTFGWKGEGPGHPGRQAKGIFYTRKGLVAIMYDIQAAGYYEVLKLIDARIAEQVKGFPKLADIVFPHGVKIK